MLLRLTRQKQNPTKKKKTIKVWFNRYIEFRDMTANRHPSIRRGSTGMGRNYVEMARHSEEFFDNGNIRILSSNVYLRKFPYSPHLNIWRESASGRYRWENRHHEVCKENSPRDGFNNEVVEDIAKRTFFQCMQLKSFKIVILTFFWSKYWQTVTFDYIIREKKGWRNV